MDKLVPLRSVYGSPSGDHDSFICYTGRTVKTNLKAAGLRLVLRYQKY